MPSFDTDVPVLLLRPDPDPFHHGTSAAARLTGRQPGRFLLPGQPAGLRERVADKAEPARLCREPALPHPATALPGSAQQAADAAPGRLFRAENHALVSTVATAFTGRPRASPRTRYRAGATAWNG
ncbi:hypothetical protein [Streptomyces halobius]|uniref:Uncharacterized protein n=1 Tax=Streptomyces halobius TaxID=2879846 RepID=A0ABY4MFY3_9ACTN|nr:hypothetical protein [Streptomyces halobius]UQA95276.1 hypothetical protein K9S39_28540 [Streptomyces halobius]